MQFENLNLKTKVGQWTISTVKLPFDHSFDNTPLWYETMLCRASGASMLGLRWADYRERYPTILAAREGHERIVAIMMVNGMQDIETQPSHCALIKAHRLTLTLEVDGKLKEEIIGDYPTPMAASVASVKESKERGNVVGVHVKETTINL